MCVSQCFGSIVSADTNLDLLVIGVKKLLPVTEARKLYLIVANSTGVLGQCPPERVPLVELHRKSHILTLFLYSNSKENGI